MGLTEARLVDAVPDLLSEFAERPWQKDVRCEAKDGVLRLSALNDFDSNGQALLDELWDAVIAYVHFDDKVSFEVEGVSVQSSLAGD
ncbi:hypothetical protein [Variovorax paradoxus]|uniref:hypothetical protein n=1 Tax=Variovorax paradoxus TaxID=34073 RepID=UPI0012D4844F|nr:hypothetical protein [Variovorax paradoxus]